MRYLCSFVMLSATIWSGVTVCLAGEKADPQAILDKAIAAHGGKEKLSKQKALIWNAKGSINLFGMKQPYTAKYAYAQPNKMRFDLDMDIGGMKVELIVVSDGKTAWEKAGDKAEEMSKEKFKEFQHTAYAIYVSSLLPLKDKAFKLTPLPDAKVGDRDVVGFKVSKKGEKDVSLFFDKKTGLHAKTETRVFDEFAKKEVNQETIFEGYRDVDGAKVFDRMLIKRDGADFLEETMSNQRSMEKVDAKLFADPTK